MSSYTGKVANSGFALARCFVFENMEPHVEKKYVENSKEQIEKYYLSKEIAEQQLESLYSSILVEFGEKDARIIKAQQLMLHDIEFDQTVEKYIETEKTTAEFATRQCYEEFCDYFLNMEDEYFRARVMDVKDIAKRLVGIQSGNAIKPFDITSPVIVVATDLTPSEAVRLSKENVAGFVTREGSSTSHTAILAGIMNIPYLYQTELPKNELIKDVVMALDGFSGEVFIDPPEATVQCIGQKQHNLIMQRTRLKKFKDRKCVTKSGKKVVVSANISGADDVQAVLENGADSIGLFRTEFMYIDSEIMPTEQQLFDEFKKVIVAMKEKRVVIRTPDLGADKRLRFDNYIPEVNPSLGLRGVRMCLEYRESFKTHLRAILRASVFGEVSILIPMVTALSELSAVKKLIDEIAFDLENERISYKRPPIGVMIETPAAAIIADDLAKNCDFFSVGTNDLVQYTLAADRQNPLMEKYYTPTHPAIKILLANIVRAAHDNNIKVSACGKFAGGAFLAKYFVELGYDELSVFPGYVLETKRLINELP